jgi:hypothetical protein
MAEVRMNPTGRVLGPEELARAAAGCDLVISDRQTAAPAAFFDQATDVVAYLRCAVDIRNIDREAASRNGVLVTHAFPGFAASVAELALGFMIDLARGVSSAVLDYRAGRQPKARMGRQLGGSTLGIIGFGVIGQHLARLGTALGMRVLVADPYKRIEEPGLTQVEQEHLLRDSDFVVCLAVATEETENLFGAPAFAAMKRSWTRRRWSGRWRPGSSRAPPWMWAGRPTRCPRRGSPAGPTWWRRPTPAASRRRRWRSRPSTPWSRCARSSRARCRAAPSMPGRRRGSHG